MKSKGDTIFAVFVYKYDDRTGEFVVADDHSSPGRPFYSVFVDSDVVLREARDMIFTALIQEYKYKGIWPGTDQILAATNKAVESAGALLIRLPRSADMSLRFKDDVGFLIGQLDAKPGDRDNFAHVRALVVKMRNDRNALKDLPELLLPAVNNPIEAI